MDYIDSAMDLPTENRPKRAIFHPQALKIYGILPKVLANRLDAIFCSLMGNHIEPNFTILSYIQKEKNVQALADWLYKDAGFSWSVSSDELNYRPSDNVPKTFQPEESFTEIVAGYFGWKITTPEPRPGPYAAVLGGQNPPDRQPGPYDAVLGG